MAEFETGLPSVRHIQRIIQDGTDVELKLLTQDLVIGKLTWQDQNCICLTTPDDQSLIIWRNAIAYIKPQS